MCEDCRIPDNTTRRGFLGALGLPLSSARRRVQRPGELPPAVQVADGLNIIPREGWAEGMPQLWAPGGEDVKFLLVHHTAGSNDYSEDGAIDQIRSAYRLHTGPDKGWPDVCYNFFIDRFGRVFEGRDGSLDGAVLNDATGGSQGFAQLVCLLGDFTSIVPSDAAIDSLRRTLAWLSNRHGLDTSAQATTEFVSRGSNKWPAGQTVTAAIISGHRDMSATACPGDSFYPHVHDSLQQEVQALREATAAPTTSTLTPTTVAPTTTATTVASTEPSTTVAAPVSATAPPSSVAAQPPTTSGSSGLSGVTIAGLGVGVGAVGATAWVLRRRLAAGGSRGGTAGRNADVAPAPSSTMIDPLLHRPVTRPPVADPGDPTRHEP